jgi:RHS repeat-associated protein
VTDTYEYDAFGNAVKKTGATPNNYLYRGEQYDSDIGLYYLRARYYNPNTGRFLSNDPEEGEAKDPKTLHKYLYAGGDPMNRIDPTGRAGEAVAGGGGALGEYAAVIGFVALQTVPQVRAFESALLCLFETETTHFFAAAMNGILYGNTGDVFENGPCSWTLDHDCRPYEEAIEDALYLVKGRYEEMLVDIHGLYRLYCKNSNAATDNGYWLGHVEKYEEAQLDLQNAIERAEIAHCPISKDAIFWSRQPPPICPAGRIPKQ